MSPFLSEKKRQNLYKQLEEVNKMIDSAGIEWIPGPGDLEHYERKKMRIEDTLNYDDMLRTAASEKEIDRKVERWNKAKDFMKNDMIESLAIQLNHEYDDEEDFEKKFGPTEDFEDVVALFLEKKCSEDIEHYAKGYIEAYPEFEDKILQSFGLDDPVIDFG